MYPLALERGIPIDVFWESSVLEIQDMMAALERMRKAEIKQQITNGFAVADAIASRIGYFFTDPNKRHESDIVQPWDSFADLFEEERIINEQKAKTRKLETYKRQLSAYAARWNER